MANTETFSNGNKLTWNAGPLLSRIQEIAAARTWQATTEVKSRVQRNISESARALGPSKEGEFPHADTGALRNSIYGFVLEQTLTGYIGTTLFYGVYLEYGTAGGQTIHAAPGGVLSWIDQASGERRFAKSVTLGPIRGRSFLRRTLNELRPRILAIYTARKWF